MTGFAGPGNETDPMTKFWSDMMSTMSAMGTATMPKPPTQEDMLKQMRRAFFDAWAVKCEEFMQSDAFLAMMKQSMESSLAFREKTNEFLKKTLADAHMPSRDDTDSILVALSSLQERMLDKLDGLSERVAALESSSGKTSAKGKKS